MKRLLIPLLLLAAMVAHADGPLSSEMKTFLVKKNDNGHEVLKPTANAAPGDTIEYRLIYKNTSEQALSGLVITGPVPDNTAYVEKSNHTKVAASFVVSADNGAHFQAEPVKRIEKNADGTKKEVVVPPGQYTHVRWQPKTAIQPGQVETFSYRVTVK